MVIDFAEKGAMMLVSLLRCPHRQKFCDSSRWTMVELFVERRRKFVRQLQSPLSLMSVKNPRW
jgi:hypothetical protein